MSFKLILVDRDAFFRLESTELLPDVLFEVTVGDALPALLFQLVLLAPRVGIRHPTVGRHLGEIAVLFAFATVLGFGVAIDARHKARSVADGPGGRRPSHPRAGAGGTDVSVFPGEATAVDVVKVVGGGRGRSPRGLWQAAVDAGVVDHLGHQTRPAALVGGPEPTARVAVEELKEPQVVSPVRIKVERVVARVDRTTTFVVTHHEMLQTMLDLFRDVAQVHVLTRAGRALDLETGAVEHVEPEQRLDKQKVHRHPDGATPIGVSTKEAGIRVTRNVADTKLLTIDIHAVGVIFVIL